MDNFVTIIGSIAAIFAIFKIINEITLSRTSKHREDYTFTKDYISDLSNPDTHRYSIEKGFRALTNDVYSVEEIKYLLSFPEPTKAIVLRSSSRKLLSFEAVTKKYEWAGIYKNEYVRSVARYFFITAYGVTAISSMMPFLIDITLDFGVIMFSVSMGIVAISCVFKNSDFADSREFMHLTANTERQN